MAQRRASPAWRSWSPSTAAHGRCAVQRAVQRCASAMVQGDCSLCPPCTRPPLPSLPYCSASPRSLGAGGTPTSSCTSGGGTRSAARRRARAGGARRKTICCSRCGPCYVRDAGMPQKKVSSGSHGCSWQRQLRLSVACGPSVIAAPPAPASPPVLAQAMALHGRKWSLVAKMVPGRTDVQCRERYMSSLNPGGLGCGGIVGCNCDACQPQPTTLLRSDC